VGDKGAPKSFLCANRKSLSQIFSTESVTTRESELLTRSQ
jgi:hypothetical protein